MKKITLFFSKLLAHFSRRWWLVVVSCLLLFCILVAQPTHFLNFLDHVGFISVNAAELVALGSLPIINIYTVLLLSTCLYLGIVFFLNKDRLNFENIQRLVLTSFLLGSIMVGSFQMLYQIKFLSFYLRQSPNAPGYWKSIIDKIHYVKAQHPYCRGWDIKTDFDLSRDPGMYIHRLWRYFLLPQDLARITTDQADCMIFFEKADYEKSVPEDFIIVESLSDVDAVAVRKDGIK